MDGPVDCRRDRLGIEADHLGTLRQPLVDALGQVDLRCVGWYATQGSSYRFESLGRFEEEVACYRDCRDPIVGNLHVGYYQFAPRALELSVSRHAG